MLVASLTVLVPLYFSIVMALKTPEQIANGSGFELPNPCSGATSPTPTPW